MAASSFEIVEQTGKRRKIRLAGRALPYRPFELSVEQRHELTWYPGSPEASMQILGASMKPTSIQGEWKDRFIVMEASNVFPEGIATINSQQVRDAQTLCWEFEQICRMGQMLKVTWDAEIRFGVMTAFDYKYERKEDIAWEATFTWVSRGDIPMAPVALNRSGLQQFHAVVQGALDRVGELTSPVSVANPTFLSKVTEKLEAVATKTQELRQTASNYVSQVQNVTNTIRRSISIATGVVDDCIGLVEETQAQVYAALLDLADVGQVTVGKGVALAAYARGLGNEGGELGRRSLEFADDFKSRVEIDIQDSYTAHEREDLRQVSFLFYGTQDEWRRLMDFNGLASSELTAGQVIYIPRLQSREEGVR